ncbi:Tetratricopeptide repeat protein [compost metagenome]
MELAKAQVEAGKNEDAIKTLRALKTEGEFKALIDQRVARLLIETGKPDEAAKLIGTADDSASLEIRGDALIAQNKRDEARELYTQALAKLDVAAPQRRLLETKLMDAGGTVADPAAEKI